MTDNGDTSGLDTFKDFYLKNRQKLFSYLMRLTGDYQMSGDVMQESFTRLLSRYEPAERSVALLFKIARNAALDMIRKNPYGCTFQGIDEPDGADGEQLILIRETYRSVLAGLKELDDSDRDLLAMVVSSSLSYSEMAVIFGMNEGHLRVRIHRARTRLRQILKRGE